MLVRVLVLVFAGLVCSSAAPAQVKEIPTVQMTYAVDIAAPPAKVWDHLVRGSSFVTWCPVWKSPANAKVILTKVGDSVDFTDSWGNGGRSIVTYLKPQRELRVAHEPADGSYLCQAKVTLSGAGGGTKLTYFEQYTDASSEADRKATAAKTGSEIRAFVAALKKLSEEK